MFSDGVKIVVVLMYIKDCLICVSCVGAKIFSLMGGYKTK